MGKQGVSQGLFQQFFLNVADTQPRAELFVKAVQLTSSE